MVWFFWIPASAGMTVSAGMTFDRHSLICSQALGMTASQGILLCELPREGTPETAGIHNQVVDDHNRMWGTAIDLTLRKLAEVAPLCQSAARGP